MERLWAPWRLEYVQKGSGSECFLCQILKESDDRNNLLLKRGKHGAIVINRFPYNNGHLMIFPNRHVADIGVMTNEERLETMKLLNDAMGAVTRVLSPDGFNIGANIGRAAGAGLEGHIHFHLVPRWNGDTNFMPVLADVKVISQSLSNLWERLYPILVDQDQTTGKQENESG
ncbi:MAG: HIT domain-containing protein [Kiritimatiellae bacterium]|nr:HIT domain-containing protein [Kiritimatiellia bacterium]